MAKKKWAGTLIYTYYLGFNCSVHRKTLIYLIKEKSFLWNTSLIKEKSFCGKLSQIFFCGKTPWSKKTFLNFFYGKMSWSRKTLFLWKTSLIKKKPFLWKTSLILEEKLNHFLAWSTQNHSHLKLLCTFLCTSLFDKHVWICLFKKTLF